MADLQFEHRTFDEVRESPPSHRGAHADLNAGQYEENERGGAIEPAKSSIAERKHGSRNGMNARCAVRERGDDSP
jgi:hypothetical protein